LLKAPIKASAMFKRLDCITYPVAVPGWRWIDQHTAVKDGAPDGKGIYYTLSWARKEYPGVSVPSNKMERDCGKRYLGGDKMDCPRVPSPSRIRGEYVRVCSKEHLEAGAAAKRKKIPPEVRDGSGRALLTLSQIRQEFGIKSTSYFVQYWSERDSRLRPGEKVLCPIPIPNPLPHGRSVVEGFVKDHIQTILRGEERAPTGYRMKVPRGRNPRNHCKKLLKEFLAKGPAPREAVLEWAKAAGIPQWRLYLAAQDLKVRQQRGPRKGYWALPSHKFPEPPDQEVINFLKTILSKGPMPSWEVQERARKKGISRKRLSRGRPDDVLVSQQQGSGVSYWHLREHALPPGNSPERTQLLDLLRGRGPMPIGELANATKKSPKIAEQLLRKLRAAGVVRLSGGKYEVVADGPPRPEAMPCRTADPVATSPSAPSDGASARDANRHRGRGRPKGSTDSEVAKRKANMLEAWDRGDFGANKAAAGRAFGFHRPDASKYIAEHEREKRRNNSRA
jgi:hypothetical protein